MMRSRRARRLSLSIRPEGIVRLTLPVACPLNDGLRFIEEKEEWIAAALERLAEKHPARFIEPPYRTRFRELTFNPVAVEKISARISKDKIMVTYPAEIPHTSPEVQQLARKAIIHALKAEADLILPPMVERLADEHGFGYGKVSVRATKSRWGSCSQNNDISLSVFLLCVPDHLCEYIILHELCHTVVKDHSPRFHKLLDSHLGGREKELNSELRGYRPDIFFADQRKK